ncbi:serine protease gd-like isoform X1 [Diorhabda sublineata]|uniref:serine protease gd-like isoform X1 n=1 Tax=Diorhabda sublineata TaxID=1163346 RepID=UPI0024E156C8|nr:serine protease gd-like isoform X1 [Diorhabda sublineata]
MFGLNILFISLFIIYVVGQELISPCPRLFEYEPRNPKEPDKIYGVLNLHSDADLNGVWLRLIFDKPSLQLGNWFGIILTDDNIVYKIQAPSKKLLAHVPQRVRFYIRYDTSKPPPKLIEYRLNAKTVCPEGIKPTIEPPVSLDYFTSPELSTTSRPVPFERPVQSPATPSFIDNLYQPNESLGSTDENDDTFVGDLNLIQRPRPNRPYLEDKCGIVIKPAQPLITYGQPTSEGEYPWHAALYHARGIDLSYICGATLISRLHLITVAHCVTKKRTQTALSPSSLIVYLGKFYLKVWSNPGIQDKQIDKIIVHQKYSSSTFANDIALLKLTEEVEITAYVRPVCLWEENTNLESVIGRQGIVVGWGFDQTGKVTDQLAKAYMPVVSQDTCIYSFAEFYSRFTTDHTYCAGFNNGKRPPHENIDGGDITSYQYQRNSTNQNSSGTSVCNGDSGGGMVFPKKNFDSANPIWQLRGMVSISVALQNQFRCDSSHYVVFTDIAKYLDWIRNALSL